MSWRIKDEFLDLARARHVVIFHNPDSGAEHHLVHEFKLAACPHCGVSKTDAAGDPLDFQKIKVDTLAALQAHHKSVLQYREKHPNVRLAK